MSTPSTEETVKQEATMDVDSVASGEAAKSEEAKPDTTASGEESKPAVKSEEGTAEGDGETTAGGEADTKADVTKLRLNGAARKRFKWLLENGYEREEAGRLAKQPLSGELRDKYAADTKKVQEVEKDTLSGAAKKRYAWLLKSGSYTKKEALILARKPMTTVAAKRNASDGAAGGPQSKFSKFTPAGSPEGITMAVTCTDYPSTALTNAQANQLKSAILKQVVQQKDAEVKPHFEYCVFSKGYLKVHCSDQKTREWLHRVVTKLELWEGASLKVVSEKKLIKSDIFTGHFNHSQAESDAEILEFIQSQNDGLDTSKWKIISRKELKPKKTTELMFTVDPVSAKSIHNLNYELNYKFVKVRLQKQEKPTAGPPPMKRPGPIQRNPASFVPIWDSNFPRNRGGNFVQEPRNPFEGPRNMNRSNVFDQNRYGAGNPKRYSGGNWNNGGGNWNSGGGNSSFAGNNMNGGGGGANFGNKGNSFNNSGGNPFNLVDSLLDQLKIIGGSNPMPSGGNFNPNRGGNFNFNNQYGGPNTANSSRNSSFSGRSGGGGGGNFNPGGNRNFFTNSKSGFF